MIIEVGWDNHRGRADLSQGNKKKEKERKEKEKEEKGERGGGGKRKRNGDRSSRFSRSQREIPMFEMVIAIKKECSIESREELRVHIWGVTK